MTPKTAVDLDTFETTDNSNYDEANYDDEYDEESGDNQKVSSSSQASPKITVPVNYRFSFVFLSKCRFY